VEGSPPNVCLAAAAKRAGSDGSSVRAVAGALACRGGCLVAVCGICPDRVCETGSPLISASRRVQLSLHERLLSAQLGEPLAQPRTLRSEIPSCREDPSSVRRRLRRGADGRAPASSGSAVSRPNALGQTVTCGRIDDRHTAVALEQLAEPLETFEAGHGAEVLGEDCAAQFRDADGTMRAVGCAARGTRRCYWDLGAAATATCTASWPTQRGTCRLPHESVRRLTVTVVPPTRPDGSIDAVGAQSTCTAPRLRHQAGRVRRIVGAISGAPFCLALVPGHLGDPAGGGDRSMRRLEARRPRTRRRATLGVSCAALSLLTRVSLAPAIRKLVSPRTDSAPGQPCARAASVAPRNIAGATDRERFRETEVALSARDEHAVQAQSHGCRHDAGTATYGKTPTRSLTGLDQR
jgi:hypothetical protein